MASGELMEYEGTKTISLETTSAPVVAANHITLNADNSTNSRFVGVLVEEHHHYGGSDSNGRKEQPGKNFQPDRSTVAKLIAKYKEEEGWMYPLPWEQSLKLEPEEFYVELTLDAYSKTGLYSKGVNTKVEDVFDPILPGGLPVQRVLVQGNAGYGKSSLCQKAVYDWAHGISTFRALPWDSSLPVLIKLRYLHQASNLEKTILDLISTHYSPPDGNQEVESFMRSLGRNLVIILDGYDELDLESQCEVINVLNAWKLWSKDSPLCCASLLVTTRPTSDEKFLMMFEKHYFISNISDDNLEILIHKFNKYTCSFITESFSKMNLIVKKFIQHPQTRLLEKCLNKKIETKVHLRDMPPLIIAVICWVIKQSGVDFGSQDIIYNCLELLSKRCNQREQFGFTDDHVAEILLRFGLLCFKIEKTVMEEQLLRDELKLDFPFLILTGILRCSGDHDGLTLWEPVHKSFLDALVYAVLACDEVETLGRNEIKEFLNSDITTSCRLIKMHVSIATNNIFFGCTEISYCSREKNAFLKWNGKYKNVSYLHKFETPVDQVFALNIKYFDGENLDAVIKDFPNFLPLVKESRLIQGLLNVQGDKLYTMCLGLKSSVKDSFNNFFPGTQNVFAKLLTFGIRFISVKKHRNVSSLEQFLEEFFDLPRKCRYSPDMFFNVLVMHFEEIGLVNWEMTVHLSEKKKLKKCSDNLGFYLDVPSSDPEESPILSCNWRQIMKVSVSYGNTRQSDRLDRDGPQASAMVLNRSRADLSDSSSESEESFKERTVKCLSAITNRKRTNTRKMKYQSF